MENFLLSLSQQLMQLGVKDIIAQGLIIFLCFWATVAGLWTLLRRKPETILLVAFIAATIWFATR